MSTSSATAAQACKAALVAAIRTLVDDGETLVSFGHPGAAVENYPNSVYVAAVDAEQDPATLGTNRAREEVLTVEVVITCWRPGGPEAEEIASDAAYGLLEAAERYVRVTDTTLGGVVRHCFLRSHRSAGATDDDLLNRGRLIVVVAEFVAHVRITG